MTNINEQPDLNEPAVTEALTADDVKKMLHEGPYDLTFIKKNGELRRGVFTLNADLIPEDKQPKNVRAPTQQEVDGQLVRAFDTYLQEFRTITVPNIVAIFAL